MGERPHQRHLQIALEGVVSLTANGEAPEGPNDDPVHGPAKLLRRERVTELVDLASVLYCGGGAGRTNGGGGGSVGGRGVGSIARECQVTKIKRIAFLRSSQNDEYANQSSETSCPLAHQYRKQEDGAVHDQDEEDVHRIPVGFVLVVQEGTCEFQEQQEEEAVMQPDGDAGHARAERHGVSR